MNSKDVIINAGNNKIELPYLNSNTIYYEYNSKDYIECKLSIKCESENGIKVSMDDIDCKLYKDGTVKGEKYGFIIKGNIKED